MENEEHLIVSAFLVGGKEEQQVMKLWNKTIVPMLRIEPYEHVRESPVDYFDRLGIINVPIRIKDLYPVEVSWFSESDLYVIEVTIIDWHSDSMSCRVGDLDVIVRYLGDMFGVDFGLGAYNWYDGTDKPGPRISDVEDENNG